MALQHFIKYWLPAIIWALVILFVSTLPGTAVAPVSEGIPYSANLAHFGEFLVFAFLLHRAIASGKNPKTALILAILASFAYSVFTELLQNYVPGRVFSYSDIMANDVGALAGLSKNILLRTKI